MSSARNLVLFILLVMCLVLVSREYWGILVILGVISLALIGVTFWLNVRKWRLARKEMKETLKAKFLNTDPPILDVEIGSLYSYPTFKVVFQSKADLVKAKTGGLCPQIEFEIEKLAKDSRWGQPVEDFDPKMAVSYITSDQ